LPLYDIKTMEERFAATLTPQRLLAYLIGGFGALALILACVGLYGVLSYESTQRAPEIGVRMALGAQREMVRQLFLWRGFRLVGTGLGLGLIAALGLAQMMRTVLFEVRPLDPVTLVSAASLLLAASMIACLIPADRASRSDPTAVLRQE
jgi:ABC-type antimicrobial peptide transport system permease subunit